MGGGSETWPVLLTAEVDAFRITSCRALAAAKQDLHVRPAGSAEVGHQASHVAPEVVGGLGHRRCRCTLLAGVLVEPGEEVGRAADEAAHLRPLG